MDDNQNLEQPLVINEENDLANMDLVDQPTNVHLLARLDDVDINSLLEPVGESDEVTRANIDGFDEPCEKGEQVPGMETQLRASRVKRKEKPEVKLGQLYKEILMNKVFEKYFEIEGEADFVASKIIDVDDENDENNTIHIERMLIHKKSDHLIHLITYIEETDEKKNRTEEKILRELPNMAFEFFEFTNDANTLIAGNRGLIVLWNINDECIIDHHQIAFKTLEDSQEIEHAGDMKNYNSSVTNDGIDIYFNVGRFLINFTIKVEEESYLIVESAYCSLEEEPRFVYVNIEEMIIAVVTTGKDPDEAAKEYMQTIKIINPEDMTEIKSNPTDKNYFDDIYFKFSGNASHMQLKVVRKQIEQVAEEKEFRLYLTNISIVSTVENKKTSFTVNFSNESAIMPEFFVKNKVTNIENSIFSTLLISYTTKPFPGVQSSDVQALMDYNLKTEIKKFDSVPCDDNPSLIHDKLILKSNGQSLTIFSLSKLKVDPTLELPVSISKIRLASPFLFITTNDRKVYCYKLLLTPKGTISPVLTEADIDYMDDKFPEYKMKKIIAALCEAKDSQNLQVYLEWKLKNLTPENFEQLPIKDTIDGKTLACTEILLQHIIKLDEDFSKIRFVYEEIEKNFEAIISSGCPSIPGLLNKLFKYDLEYGTPKSEYLPLYQTYDFRGSSLRGYYFGNSSENDKDYAIQTSLVKVPDILGTSNSLSLTKCLTEVEDMKIFGTEFMKTYIRSKWASMKAAILGLTVLMWLNIFLVGCLVTHSTNSSYFYWFVFVNTLLVTSELIQAANLGLQEYIGIDNINYSSVLQLMVSIFLATVYTDWYIYALFVLLQAYTNQKFFKNADIISTVGTMALVATPAFLFLIIFIFTSHPFYYLVVFGILELAGYFASYLAADLLLGLRLGLQFLSITFFVIYQPANLYLLIFNLILLTSETLYLVKLIRNAECRQSHIIDYIICFICKSLVVTSFILEQNIYAFIGLVIIVLYSLVRSALVYMNFQGEKLKLMSLFCYRYGTYLLFAFIITDNHWFLLAFVLFSVAEFVWLRSDSFKGLIDDIGQLLFNWNTIDILRYVISIYWIIKYKMIQVELGAQYTDQLPDKTLTWVFVLLNLIKALLGFRAFDGTRFYVRLIFKCVVDIIPFLIIFVFFTISFGLLNVVDRSTFDFPTLWGNPFDQSIGGFSHNDNETLLQYVMFSMGTLLIVIIMLNLLISILGDTFSRFLDEAKLIDYKVMIETVYEVEVLMFWRKWTSSVKYFSSCDNLVASEEEIQTAWQARLESIESKLAENRDELNKTIQGVKDHVNERLDSIVDMLNERSADKGREE